jgi:glycerol-3-phosphate dehydrogenase
VYAVLYEGFSPNDAVVELMTREPKPEHAEPAR